MSQDPTIPAYSAIYAFGDSLSDAGNLSISTGALGTATPAAPPYASETYRTALGQETAAVFSNGPTWVQDLSLTLGTGILKPSLYGGTDFAYGGAETGATPQNANDPDILAVSLNSQLVQFEAEVARPASDALYTLSIGANDLLDILGSNGLSVQQQTTDVQDAVGNEIGFVQNLIGDGAKNLLVLDVPDLGQTPEVRDGLANGSGVPSASFDATASALAAEYNSDLISRLDGIATHEGVNVTIVDAYQLIDDAVNDPAAYGLTNVTTPVWSGSYSDPASGTLAATGQAAQDQYLFFDHLHPTETGEMAVAALAAQDLGITACFAAGTRIATARGDVPVERLAVGDTVRLAEGGTAPVIWLGHRQVGCRRHPRPEDVRPVRIVAHAFGLARPYRDLLLSPDHAVFVDGVLIPIRYLLNDATVRQEEVPAVTYWHVELPAHAALLAEGLPAESYLDTGNRTAFANCDGAMMAYPDFARAVWAREGCAPLVTEGPARDLVYRRLLAQAFVLGWGLRDAGEGAFTWNEPARAAAAG